MVRKAARTVKSLEKPQSDSPTTRRSRRQQKSESEPEAEEAVTVSNEKNEISEQESDQEYEKKSKKSGRSSKSKKSHRRKDKSPSNDAEGDEAVTERKSKKGKSKDKHKRKSHNVNDTEIKNDNVQGANQSPFQDETGASNFTETSNLEEPQPDNDDTVDTQPTENVEFGSVNAANVKENTPQSEETTTGDPLADPLRSQSPSNVILTQESNENSQDSISDNHVVQSSTAINSTQFEENANNEPTETEEKQNESSNTQKEISAEACQQNEESVKESGEISQGNKDSTVNKSEELPSGKRIQLKRNISEKKDRFIKSGDEKSEKNVGNEKAQVTKDAVEASTDFRNHEDENRESKSRRKITLKRPSESNLTSKEESAKTVDRQELKEDSKKPVEKGELQKDSAKHENNPPQNSEELEEGEWTSTYELNGQEEKAKEEDKDNYSRKKISLKRRTTTEEKDRSARSRDKPERSVSLKESTRRRSLRESESDFEIKKRPTKDRRTSEVEEKIVIKPKKPTKVVKINRAVLTPVPKSTEKGSECPQETKTQQEDNKQESTEISVEKGPKKYKWGDSETKIRVKLLNFEIVKEACPTIEFLKEGEVNLELSPLEKKRLELEQRKQLALERKQQGIEEIEIEEEVIPIEERENILSKNRTISIVDDTASKLKPPPSPAKNPLSNILHVSNLVRPFTVKQLKDLLERTGTIKEDGFWTDRIKSKCYAVYETTEEAEATRNALHGVSWPIGNGKQLVIEYATEEEMERAKNPPPPVRRERTPEKENQIPETLEDVQIKNGDTAAATRDWDSRRRDSGGDKMRELDGHHRKRHSGGEREGERRHHSRSKSRERARKHNVRKSISPEGHHHHKRKKHEEPVEQKAMDDLFMKTKATPSIYWQPLSPEEIAQKQRQREARLEENRRRMEEKERRPPQQHPSNSGGYRDRNFRRR